MTKKKLTALILLGILLLYFISCGFIFLLAREIQTGNFLTFANNENESFRERLHYSETLESVKSNFIYRNYTPNYPAVIALVDKNGNLVYMVFRKDYDSHKNNPNELLDIFNNMKGKGVQNIEEEHPILILLLQQGFEFPDFQQPLI